MDFWTLLDSFWFRIIILPINIVINIVIFYYVSKWALKKFPSLKETVFYNQEQWETAEKHEKKIISWFKRLFVNEKKGGPFL